MTSPTRILLINDDQVSHAAVRRALAKSGLTQEIDEATAGTGGLRMARPRAYDRVLLDYRPPDVATFALLAGLLSPEGGGHAVLMLTGEADPDIAFRPMRAGALDYLAKAEVTPSSLARAIRYAKARHEFLAELSAAHREAEAKSLECDSLNKQKSVLFSIIAKNLRNPFQALLGLSTVLSQAVATRDHAPIERHSQGIREATTQAYGLMEGLFARTSLQLDTLVVALGETDVDEVAREVLKGAGEAASDKGLTLRAECDCVRVGAQRDLLATVQRNLVTNAVKFTLPGGAVTVAARRHDDTVEISVNDTGVGMPPGVVAHLFKLDRGVTTNGTAGERGSGRGLLPCVDLLERQGGELVVWSVIDQGTTFRFSLPAPSDGSPMTPDKEKSRCDGDPFDARAR